MDFIDKKKFSILEDKIKLKLDKIKKLKTPQIKQEIIWCNNLIENLLPKIINTKSKALTQFASEEKINQALKDLNLEVVMQLNIIKYKKELEKKLNSK
ncbi:hypothetical protein J4403_02695 [Candidatus Woesearchaeota archaeon]|nr:hypothetical protein [Candidatus Woesearchaeota archaeon]